MAFDRFSFSFATVFRCITTTLVAQFLVFGILFAFIFPPFQTPDEQVHYRAGLTNYARISQGNNEYCGLSQGMTEHMTGAGSFGTSVLDESKFKESCRKVMTYGWVFTYPSVLIASAVTKDSTKRSQVLLRFYLSRIINGLLVVGFFWRFLQIVLQHGFRPGSFLLFGFLLSPLFLQQSWSINADMSVNMLGLQLAMILLYLPQLSRWDIVAFGINAFVACSSKPVISLLIPPTLLLAQGLHKKDVGLGLRQLGKVFSDRLFLTGLSASLLGIAITLLQIATESEKGRSNVGLQLQFVLENPWQTFTILNSSLEFWMSRAIFYFHSHLGYFVVPTTVYMDSTYYVLFDFFFLIEFIFLALALYKYWRPLKRIFPDQNRSSVAAFGLLGLLALYGSLLFPILTMYITWTPVGGTHVEGVQPRYFYPMVFAGIGIVGSLLMYLAQSYPNWNPPVKKPTEGGNFATLAICMVLMVYASSYWSGLFYEVFKYFYKA